MILIRSDEYDTPAVWTMGTIGALFELEEENEAVRKLHEAVKEVTGKAVEPAPRPRIGFLP